MIDSKTLSDRLLSAGEEEPCANAGASVPPRLRPVLDAFEQGMYADFCAEFGREAFDEYLADALVCLDTDSIKPRSKEAREWLYIHAHEFFLEYLVMVGEVLKEPANA